MNAKASQAHGRRSVVRLFAPLRPQRGQKSRSDNASAQRIRRNPLMDMEELWSKTREVLLRGSQRRSVQFSAGQQQPRSGAA